jgi:hypothetical protein
MIKRRIVITFFILFSGFLNFFPEKASAGQLDIVDAYFAHSDGCIITEVFIYAHSGKYDNEPEVSVRVSQTDECDGTKDAILAEISGSAKLPSNVLKVDNKLEFAEMKLTIPVSDLIKKNKYNLQVDLNWKGDGDLIPTLTDFYFQTPGSVIKLKKHSEGNRRFAICSGSVSDGYQNFIFNFSQDAEILSLKMIKEKDQE